MINFLLLFVGLILNARGFKISNCMNGIHKYSEPNQPSYRHSNLVCHSKSQIQSIRDLEYDKMIKSTDIILTTAFMLSFATLPQYSTPRVFNKNSIMNEIVSHIINRATYASSEPLSSEVSKLCLISMTLQQYCHSGYDISQSHIAYIAPSNLHLVELMSTHYMSSSLIDRAR